MILSFKLLHNLVLFLRLFLCITIYSMLIAISVGVIISCLLSSILVLVCCFCSKCPLYSVCHSKYEHNDTIAFCKFLEFKNNEKLDMILFIF